MRVKVKPSRSLYYGGRLYSSGEEFKAGEDFDRWQHVELIEEPAEKEVQEEVKHDDNDRDKNADKAIKGGQVRKK